MIIYRLLRLERQIKANLADKRSRAALWAVDLEKEQDALRHKKPLKDAYSSKIVEK